jgi:hypothetical protein
MKSHFTAVLTMAILAACATGPEKTAAVMPPSLLPDYFGIQWKIDEANWSGLAKRSSCSNVADGTYQVQIGETDSVNTDSKFSFQITCTGNMPHTMALSGKVGDPPVRMPLESVWFASGMKKYFAFKWPVFDIEMIERLGLENAPLENLVFVFQVQSVTGRITLYPSDALQSQIKGMAFFQDNLCMKKHPVDGPALPCTYALATSAGLDKSLAGTVVWQTGLPITLMRSTGPNSQ